MSKKLISALIILGVMFIFLVSLIAESFGNVKNRYKEIEPNLDNYSAAEVLILSFERMRTALLSSNDKDFDAFFLKKQIFKSKINILNNKSSFSNAFFYDDDFLKKIKELKKKESIMDNLFIKLSNGEIDKTVLLSFMNEMEFILIDLQEIVYAIQIKNFNEVKTIIENNSNKTEILAISSLILILLVLVITIRTIYFLKEIIKKKNLFISSIYHELAFSTQAIVIAADIIEHELDENELKNESRIISHHANKIIEQTREIMDYSRLEMGETNVNIAIFSINDLINDAINEVNKEGTNLFKVINSIYRNKISSDKYKIYRIIVNLLDNANKYTKNGIIIINVKIFKKTLFIFVKDNGIGFNVRKLNNLFKAFNQDAEKETKQGLGLGLTIIKHYVECLKGNIRVKSKKGIGSSFFISIPIELTKE